MLFRALQDCKKAHEGQYREGGEEYYLHPLRVMGHLVNEVNEEIILTAALLHDVLEDTDMKKSYISAVYNEEVADIVGYLTKPKKGTWVEKTQAKIKACKKNRKALYIYMYDALDNIQGSMKLYTQGLIDLKAYMQKLSMFEYLVQEVFPTEALLEEALVRGHELLPEERSTAYSKILKKRKKTLWEEEEPYFFKLSCEGAKQYWRYRPKKNC